MLYCEDLLWQGGVLKNLKITNCNKAYVDWLNDSEVNKFLETRWYIQTIEGVKDYVDKVNRSNHSYLFGIFYKTNYSSNAHIGNIKIGPINKFYNYADISYFIGEKTYWGKGLATEVIKTILRFGFETIGLNRIQAGVFGSNIGSIKALEKAGFVFEGNLRKQLSVKDCCEDHLVYGILKEEWIKNNK